MKSAEKYIFAASAGLLLILMLLSSSDAGINCDEVLHYDHSVAVWNYFSSHGKDSSALNTPVSMLKYYGQSYDNITTILARLFHIDNVYGFRHIMSTLAGWLAVLVTALFAFRISGFRAAVIVIVLYAVSPTFLGHSQNNLKDIPFALGYIASLFFILEFLESGEKRNPVGIILLILSISFALSIRAGGLLLICYFFLFAALWYIFRYFKSRQPDLPGIRNTLLYMLLTVVVSWALSILLWPFALQSPVANVLESYRVMAHFPSTFQQIFEGRVEWSDYMPWYYLLKSMGLTIPLVVTIGVLLFAVFIFKTIRQANVFQWIVVIFSLLFPIFFVMYEKSNLYSSWRQFLFVYPVVILISAEGISRLLGWFSRSRIWSVIIISAMVLLTIHPVRFMLLNHRYSYLYYNELAGGLKGALGNYETDYYYVSQTEASQWLLDYLKTRNETGNIKVSATYSVSWLFRKYPSIETEYFRNEERSMTDWDYAIIANRYIPPYQLKNNLWPPARAIHVVYADGVPLCAVLKRDTKDDYLGYRALCDGKTEDAVKLLGQAVGSGTSDEMLFYNFGVALHIAGQEQKADSVLKAGLKLNPGFTLINMYMGNLARSAGRVNEAIGLYEKVIASDRKYFEAYVELAKLLDGIDQGRAREILRNCLRVNPHYGPAIRQLAETYRNSDPEVARKYDELLKSLNL
jgi:tetratricopeptide (TPR) repeat protein